MSEGAKVIQVIETQFCRGLGRDDDPVRLVTSYWTTDGVLLAERDYWLEDKYEKWITDQEKKP